MPALDANALELFARVVAAGSFAQAARQLGLTRAAVSRRIAAIEAAAGHTLLARTTRSLGLTEPGRRLAHRAKAVLDASDAARAVLRASGAALAGRLRITAVASFGRSVLAPLLVEFQRLHPGVGFELMFTDRRVDLMREGIDVAFRLTRRPPEDWVATPVLPMRVGAFAAPSLLPQALRHPEALGSLPWLVMGAARDDVTLVWRHPTQPPAEVQGRAASFGEDIDSLITLARLGAGVVLAPDYAVAEDVASGRLVDLLPPWHLPIAEGDTVFALTLPHPLATEATRALVRHVQLRLGGPPGV